MPAVVALLAGLAVVAAGCARQTPVLGFWFEDVTFSSPMLGGPLTPGDLRVIDSVAREELAHAFRGLDVRLTDSRDARYRINVVQKVVLRSLNRETMVAGESRALSWVGGSGSVNFLYFASGALSFAPPGASRSDLVVAIGRGLGRGAAHEFAHQLIRGVEIHDSRDRGSYEYYAASRAEQYFGPMHWDIAGPFLKQRYGRRSATARR